MPKKPRSPRPTPRPIALPELRRIESALERIVVLARPARPTPPR
jgi:hypothetical protein